MSRIGRTFGHFNPQSRHLEAEKKIASQLSVAEQRKLADMVIENNGDLVMES